MVLTPWPRCSTSPVIGSSPALIRDSVKATTFLVGPLLGPINQLVYIGLVPSLHTCGKLIANVTSSFTSLEDRGSGWAGAWIKRISEQSLYPSDMPSLVPPGFTGRAPGSISPRCRKRAAEVPARISLLWIRPRVRPARPSSPAGSCAAGMTSTDLRTRTRAMRPVNQPSLIATSMAGFAYRN